MSSPEQKRKFNTIAGTLFSIASVLFFGFTAYFVFVPAPVKPAPVKLNPLVSRESCADYLRNSLQLTPDFAGGANILKVHGELSQDLDMTASEYFLDRMSLATVVCQYQLKEFCMGEECTDGKGVHFTLVLPEQKAPEVKAATPSPAASAGGAKKDPKK